MNDRRFTVFCLAVALIAHPVSSAFAQQAGVETIKDIEVGKSGDQMMHVDIQRSTKPQPNPMPVVFTMHSGGWKDGTHHNCFGRGSLWTKGYTIVSIEYHPAGPNARWPVQLQDCLHAVRWMRANAAKYNVDPNRFAVSGESAGAHLATCVAVYGDDPKYADKDFPGVSAAVQAVVIGSGPLDILSSNRNHTDQKLKWNVENLLGGNPERKPEEWNEACMVLHVSEKLPPFFIWHGEKDSVIPIDEANHFVEELKKEGVPCEFIPVKNGGHDALRSVQKDAPLEPDGNVVLKQMTAFLDKYVKQPVAH
jgi:acetyl esterase/lipase